MYICFIVYVLISFSTYNKETFFKYPMEIESRPHKTPRPPYYMNPSLAAKLHADRESRDQSLEFLHNQTPIV